MKALVTGITGQDGSLLAEVLLSRGYEVHGIVRRLSVPNIRNLDALRGRVVYHEGDLIDQSSLDTAVREVNPDEVYNLGAQSFVGTSWTQPVLTTEVTGLGALRILESVRRFADKARFYQAGSSEMFGNEPAPQNEASRLSPRSPYGVAKVMAHNFARTYRESYGMFISNGILFNHESERRGEEFVTRKVSRWAAAFAVGRPYTLRLGNVNARRDWGYAPDYVDLMTRTLRQTRPDDFVGATGVTHSVADLLQEACSVANIHANDLVKWYEPNAAELQRPAEVHELRGDASKAKRELGWEPTVGFSELVRRMVAADVARLRAAPPLVVRD